ncbi:DNA cytosine methyltransferase [Synechococcus sp. PCC 6312]|uniref:DNA cytosine methyltransferase n=1 Tax=Synechococcus sp. (strain ATCC 27167 / PCC 6312) TaxID=195253 RepID=UPI00029ED64D|nr:DNA cytosine methyltransferase [Synechococcus sp. PCC 6312]AFY61292.1 DNA-methyltransferase Dcm [Synechococcus sp. PCC 6312]
MIRFIDLFAGIGGMRLGLEQACQQLGLESKCVLSSEIDRKAKETYALNFNEVPQGDIRQVSEIPKFDFMLAGFPCQPFSHAGKQKGFGDTRGTLFFEIERILEQCQPKGFLLENVRGLTTHDRGRTFQTILHSLEKLGYKTNYLLLNSSNFSLAQNRVRIYIIGLLHQYPILTIQSDRGAIDSHSFKQHIVQPSLFDESLSVIKVKDILETQVSENYYVSRNFEQQLLKAVGYKIEKLYGVRLIDFRGGNSIHSWDLGLKGKCTQDERDFMNALISNRRLKAFGKHQDGKSLTLDQIQTFFNHDHLYDLVQSLIEKGYLKEHNGKFNPICGNMSFEIFKILDPDSISITLTSSDASRIGVIHQDRIRRITPRECARLQGFPETFAIHHEDHAAYKQLGNAVSVPVVKAIIKDLFDNENNRAILMESNKFSKFDYLAS